MNFARRIGGGHMGPRKFWHHVLPRLKYHNPAVGMTVERTEDQEGPASLTVFFGEEGSGGEKGRTEEAGKKEVRSRSINMKNRKEGEILEELLRMTGGKAVLATPAEEQQLKDLEQERRRGEGDRVRQAAVLKGRRRQQQILQQAKQSMDLQ